jgi:hypothetical protein
MVAKHAVKRFNVASQKNFVIEKWQTDLKAVMIAFVNDIRPTCLLFTERELEVNEVLSDLDALMAHGEIMSMLSEVEHEEIVVKMKQSSAAASILGTTESKSDSMFIDDFKTSCRNNIKMLFTLTPTSNIFRKRMREYSHLLNNSTVIVLGDWGNTGLSMVAEGIIGNNSESIVTDSFDKGKIILVNKKAVLTAMVEIYRDV